MSVVTTKGNPHPQTRWIKIPVYAVLIAHPEGKFLYEVTLSDDAVRFALGSAELTKEGKAALDNVAEAFKGLQGRSVLVAGYTDDVPTNPKIFPTNWELSAARAIAVVRYLQEEKIDPALLAAAGYGQFQPIAPNDTPEGRAENRRIQISLAAPLSAAVSRQ